MTEISGDGNIVTELTRAVPPGGCGGVTPPKKSKKGGPNLRGGGPGMLELQNFLKMKDFFAENFGNFWKKLFCERFRELLFSKI
jgi:hypothetical protein